MKWRNLSCRSTEFGRLLSFVMRQRGLTSRDVASRAGINLRHLYRLQAGVKEPTWAMVCRLADTLNCRTDDFRDWEKR